MPDFDFNAKDGKWFYMSHEFTDALIQQNLTGTEFRLLLCLARWAWSWKHSWVIMRWGKIKKRTGLNGGTAWKALIRLKARNIVNSFPQETEKGLKYKINSKFKTWKPVEPYKPVSHRKPKEFPTGNKSVSHRKVTPLKEHIKETCKEPLISPTEIKPLTKTEILKMDAESVIDFMNDQAGKHFKKTQANLAPIRARIKEYSLQDCLEVAYKKWHDSDLDNKYYRPITLFRPSLFDGYLNEKGTKQKPTKYQTKMRSIVEVFARRHYERQNPTDSN